MIRFLTISLLVFTFFASPLVENDARAEYGDKVMNNWASASGMRPVVFPHWVHRIRVRCKVCHQDLNFKIMLGSNNIKMSDIIQGKYCGACHNGRVAWTADNCDRCHTGMPLGQTIPDKNLTLTTAPETKGYNLPKKNVKKAVKKTAKKTRKRAVKKSLKKN